VFFLPLWSFSGTGQYRLLERSRTPRHSSRKLCEAVAIGATFPSSFFSANKRDGGSVKRRLTTSLAGPGPEFSPSSFYCHRWLEPLLNGTHTVEARLKGAVRPAVCARASFFPLPFVRGRPRRPPETRRSRAR